MKIIKDLIEKMEDTLEEIEFYAMESHHLRAEHKALSETYAKVGEMHIEIYKMLHERAVSLINEEKQKGVAVPPEMLAIWDFSHRKLIERFNKAKYLVDEYKKAY
jgi:hypothetical protein